MADPTFHVLIKAADGEQIQAMTEAQISKVADPTAIEIFLTDAEAVRRKLELSHARTLKAHRYSSSRMKTHKQREEFAKANPEIAKTHNRKHIDTLDGMLASAPKGSPEAKRLEVRIAALNELIKGR